MGHLSETTVWSHNMYYLHYENVDVWFHPSIKFLRGPITLRADLWIRVKSEIPTLVILLLRYGRNNGSNQRSSRNSV